MLEAESVVGHSSDFSNLHKFVSGEFTSITKYLQKLIGTNHPMLETAKRCSYISEGKMGSAQARGLIAILTAKAIEGYSVAGERPMRMRRPQKDLIRDQISLAEMAEITYSAYMMHRGVMDLKIYSQPEVHKDGSELTSQAKGIHYGNKVSILCGDFLLAYVMRGLGDLFNSEVVELIASAITDFMEGEFLLLEDWKSKNYLLSEESRDLSRWERRSYSTIGSLQGNVCQGAVVLANEGQELQMSAREFGKNLGLAWQAHTELQPFLEAEYEPIQLAEMPPFPAFDLNCLPVLHFLRESHKSNKNFRLLISQVKPIESSRIHIPGFINQHVHQEAIDYKKLHELVLDNGLAIDETYKTVRVYSQTALYHLRKFPENEARDALEKICISLYDERDI